MSGLDLFILTPLLIGAFRGYRKGLIVEAFGILAFVFAIILGFKLLYFGASIVEGFLGIENIRWLSPYLSFFVVFLPALYLIRLVGTILKKAVRLTPLGMLDGLFGAVIGVLTAAFGISLLLLFAQRIGVPMSSDESFLYTYVADFAPKTISFISDLVPGGNWVEYLKGLKGSTEPLSV